MWIHEGFCTYMQALYMEELKGMAGYHEFMDNSRRFPNNLAVAPLASQTSKQIYLNTHLCQRCLDFTCLARRNRQRSFIEIHASPVLRQRCLAEKIVDGSQCHFVTTHDFQLICEAESGKPLGWFFDVYLRQANLPKLVSKVEGQAISLHWKRP